MLVGLPWHIAKQFFFLTRASTAYFNNNINNLRRVTEWWARYADNPAPCGWVVSAICWRSFDWGSNPRLAAVKWFTKGANTLGTFSEHAQSMLSADCSHTESTALEVEPPPLMYAQLSTCSHRSLLLLHASVERMSGTGLPVIRNSLLCALLDEIIRKK